MALWVGRGGPCLNKHSNKGILTNIPALVAVAVVTVEVAVEVVAATVVVAAAVTQRRRRR